jgi:G3E family GTPase
MAPTPITLLTGFLGSGKTTLILNLLPQLPSDYKIALLKNEYGALATDTLLASSPSLSGITELLNGCICCNLVGALGPALHTLRNEHHPSRIVIETSGSAFPATLALEITRLARESRGQGYALDGVVSCVDVENWQGYVDTSFTAALQVRWTDLVVFNKWENAGERRWDECLDRLGDIEVVVPWVRSRKGWVDWRVLLGVDGGLVKGLRSGKEVVEVEDAGLDHAHDHHYGNGNENGNGEHGEHSSEVDVLDVTLKAARDAVVNLKQLKELLTKAPKDEVYRIKSILTTDEYPQSSEEEEDPNPRTTKADGTYILNWAFGRWTFTKTASAHQHGVKDEDHVLRMTMILARDEAPKWKKRLEAGGYIAVKGAEEQSTLVVERIT